MYQRTRKQPECPSPFFVFIVKNIKYLTFGVNQCEKYATSFLVLKKQFAQVNDIPTTIMRKEA